MCIIVLFASRGVSLLDYFLHVRFFLHRCCLHTNRSLCHCTTACLSAKQLSSTDWTGFDLIWKERDGNRAVREALESYVAFEKVTTPWTHYPAVAANPRSPMKLIGPSLPARASESSSTLCSVAYLVALWACITLLQKLHEIVLTVHIH